MIIQIHKFIEQLLAPFLRQPNRINWLRSLLSPLSNLWDNYADWRADKFYEARVTPQVISLEAYLNRLFDPQKKRIEIERGVSKDRYLSLWSEPNGSYFNAESENTFLYLDGEYNDTILDGFTVFIPESVDESQLCGILDTAKAVGTTYEIKIRII